MAGEEILLSNQRQTMEQAKFPLAKAFEKQITINKEHGRK